MIKRDLQNERLDRIGRRLVKAARTSDEEIEKIVAAPHLFDSVMTKIKAESPTRQKTNRFFGDWSSMFVWNRQSAAAGLAAFIVLIAGTLAVTFQKNDVPQLVNQTIRAEIKTQVQPPKLRAENPSPTTEIIKTNIPAVKKHLNVEQAALKTEKTEKPKLPHRTRQSKSVKSLPDVRNQAPEIFYSLTASGNWEAMGEDLQIVRAELSKSELFALGVNLPVENEAPKVKTDLLVNRDGVARAIRFVE